MYNNYHLTNDNSPRDTNGFDWTIISNIFPTLDLHALDTQLMRRKRNFRIKKYHKVLVVSPIVD